MIIIIIMIMIYFAQRISFEKGNALRGISSRKHIASILSYLSLRSALAGSSLGALPPEGPSHLK